MTTQLKSLEPKKSTLMVRGLNYAIYEWGDKQKPSLFLIHGWMDTGLSFKFIAPYLIKHFHIYSFDMRGFGESEHVQTGYWFPDYFADLDAVLEQLSPDQKVNLVGHSMGANIGLFYAGIRPERVDKIMILDWIGLPPTKSEDTPEKYRKWMKQVADDEPTKIYPNIDVLKASMRAGNPSFSEEVIEQMIPLWAKPYGDNGEMVLRADHQHRNLNPVRSNFEDALAVFSQVKAKAGLIIAGQSFFKKAPFFDERVAIIKDTLNISEEDFTLLEEAHHMFHIEMPEKAAASIIQFFISN